MIKPIDIQAFQELSIEQRETSEHETQLATSLHGFLKFTHEKDIAKEYPRATDEIGNSIRFETITVTPGEIDAKQLPDYPATRVTVSRPVFGTPLTGVRLEQVWMWPMEAYGDNPESTIFCETSITDRTNTLNHSLLYRIPVSQESNELQFQQVFTDDSNQPQLFTDEGLKDTNRQAFEIALNLIQGKDSETRLDVTESKGMESVPYYNDRLKRGFEIKPGLSFNTHRIENGSKSTAGWEITSIHNYTVGPISFHLAECHFISGRHKNSEGKEIVFEIDYFEYFDVDHIGAYIAEGFEKK